MSLALSCIDEARRRTVLEALEFLFTALEARHNPLFQDLAGERPDADIAPLRSWLLPVLNSARALTAAVWSVPGSQLCVALCSTAPGAPPERRFLAWGEQKLDALRLRAAFAAWPITAAQLLEFRSIEARQRATLALEQHLSSVGAQWGVFLDSNKQQAGDTLTGTPVCRTLSERAARLLRRAPHLEDPILLGLASAGREPPRSRPLLAELPLRPTELLVVPRLSALSRKTAAAASLRRALETAGTGEFKVLNG